MEGARIQARSRGTREFAAKRQVREAVIVAIATFVGVAGVVWGTLYIVLGVPGAALYPYGFTIVSVLNLVEYRRSSRIEVLATVEIIAMLLIPFILMVHLGGLTESGAVGVWSFLAPLGAILVFGRRPSILVFVAFVATIAIGVWADSSFDALGSLSTTATRSFVFLNVVGVAVVSFLAMQMFLTANNRLVAEQERLRAIEKSFVAQEAMLRQQDRLATLGQLSAGIAHELNNPAAAATRSTDHLHKLIGRLAERTARLVRLDVEMSTIDRIRAHTTPSASIDPIDRADREDELAQWLTRRSIPDPQATADRLVEAGFDVAVFDAVSDELQDAQVLAAAEWIGDTIRLERLVGEIGTSAERISEIVGALKGYSHMDGADRRPVDLERGVADTLVILKSQLSDIEVVVDIEPDLPEVVGHPGELNQVWTNLLANAAEAMGGRGRIEVEIRNGTGAVVLNFSDTGPGVAPDIIDTIFDPFVTTKAPGEGVGLGLNLSHQIIVERHGGSIAVTSAPGATTFTVRLPTTEGARP